MKKISLFIQLKEFWVYIVIFIVIILTTIFLLIPKIKQSFNINNEISSQTLQINNLSNKLADLQSLSEAELFESSNLLLEALPAQKDFYLFLTTVKKIFTDNKIAIEEYDMNPGNITVANSSSQQNLDPAKIKLKFNGMYSDFQNLAKTIENSFPIMGVDSIKFNNFTATDSGNLQKVTGEVVVSTYSLNLPLGLGKIEKPLIKLTSQQQKIIDTIRTFNRASIQTKTDFTVTVGKENPFLTY